MRFLLPLLALVLLAVAILVGLFVSEVAGGVLLILTLVVLFFTKGGAAGAMGADIGGDGS